MSNLHPTPSFRSQQHQLERVAEKEIAQLLGYPEPEMHEHYDVQWTWDTQPVSVTLTHRDNDRLTPLRFLVQGSELVVDTVERSRA